MHSPTDDIRGLKDTSLDLIWRAGALRSKHLNVDDFLKMYEYINNVVLVTFVRAYALEQSHHKMLLCLCGI